LVYRSQKSPSTCAYSYFIQNENEAGLSSSSYLHEPWLLGKSQTPDTSNPADDRESEGGESAHSAASVVNNKIVVATDICLTL